MRLSSACSEAVQDGSDNPLFEDSNCGVASVIFDREARCQTKGGHQLREMEDQFYHPDKARNPPTTMCEAAYVHHEPRTYFFEQMGVHSPIHAKSYVNVDS